MATTDITIPLDTSVTHAVVVGMPAANKGTKNRQDEHDKSH